MRLCFLVDARSVIAVNWIRHFLRSKHEVHVISSHKCAPEALEGAVLHQVPIAFGGIDRDNSGARRSKVLIGAALRRLDRLTNGLLRSWVTPIDLLPHVQRIRRLCDTIAPDLIHAMRIPYEGIMAALAVHRQPLLISCWGNDFTLFTSAAPDRFLTRYTMQRADALHCDCEKDVKLARKWGFECDKPSIVLPGAGGIDSAVFHPGRPQWNGWKLDISPGMRAVINPRGMRMYVRNDVFFRAIPLIIREHPNTVFICPGMSGVAAAEKMVRDLNIVEHVRLLPIVTRDKLAELYRRSQVSISPSVHDGTPNTLLEAMASGCFPVAGNIESVREWIEDGKNGFLYDPNSQEETAATVCRALHEEKLRQRAAVRNVRLVMERAEYAKVMARAELFYEEIFARFSESSVRTRGRLLV